MKQVFLELHKNGYFTSEAYKELRTNLQFCGQEKKVIALTSCLVGEGKSTVSLQLAISLAESGKRTIYIEADLRKSMLLGKINTNRQEVKGLSHLLTSQSTLQETVCCTNVPYLDLVVAGTYPPNPAELLGGNTFKSVIDGLRNVYDYIIIDTPPIGQVIDAAVISECCDGVILVIKAGNTSYHLAQKVKQQLEMTNCPILGAVLNQVDIEKSSYGKYGKYNYGHEED